MRPLAGKSALITGSVQGLGLAAARRLAAAGCRLVLHGLAAPEAATALQRELAAAFDVDVVYFRADLRHVDEIERLAAEASAVSGGVDVLVNNAVVRHAGPVDTFPTHAWDETIAVNLSAAFHTIRLLLPGMKARNWGRIINVSSIYGLVGAADRIGYVTTKTALVGLTRAVALETAAFDITCNAICPGTSRTPVHEAALATLMAREGLDEPAARARLLREKQPTGRFVEADGVAGLVVFLCSPEGRDITGAALPIDGGWSAR